jgi:CRISPR-associated endonuclease/helicase Cas3
MFFAHSLQGKEQGKWQSLPEHLGTVSDLTAERAQKFDAARLGALVGMLHDLGKYSRAFQDYIAGRGQSPDHATAGACQILTLAAKSGPDRIAALLGAYCIAGHHSGLSDWLGQPSLSDRLKKELPALDPSWHGELLLAAEGIMPAGFKWREGKENKQSLAFQLAMFGRMVFSCLVDADFRDTERFYLEAEGKSPDRDWPGLQTIIDGLIARFNTHMEKTQADAADSELNRLRADILSHVRGKAALPRGVFTLNVPTGGGKTLASLGFALDHAKTHGMHRIVYGIPFTSIIDQTAEIFRHVLGRAVVLEHHAAIEDERQDRKPPNQEGEREAGEKMRLAMEDWAAPIVVTTNVQLFESLFANRTSRCRKLHNLTNAVIILDEAQTIPLKLLRPCVAALDELVRNYGCSVVFCTATQPALGAPKFKDGFEFSPERELAPDPHGLAEKLRRVRLVNGGDTSDTSLVDALRSTERGLIIVNSRKHALALYRAAEAAGLDGLVHLTTRQYSAHRRQILERVRKALEAKTPCRLIATSLIEAGVDVDFPQGWRAQAGLDQIAQAAGRVNREGKRLPDESLLTIFRAPDYPPPPEIKSLSGDMDRMMGRHTNLFSPAAIQDFFGEVYWRMDVALDQNRILDGFRIGGGIADFSYRSVAENFRMIESGMVPIIVARDETARRAVNKLSIAGIPSGGIARELQTYIVQVPPKARQRMIDCGRVAFANPELRGEQFAVLLSNELYHENVGLVWEDVEYLSAEGLVW